MIVYLREHLPHLIKLRRCEDLVAFLEEHSFGPQKANERTLIV